VVQPSRRLCPPVPGEPGTGDLEEHGVCGSEGVGGGL